MQDKASHEPWIARPYFSRTCAYVSAAEMFVFKTLSVTVIVSDSPGYTMMLDIVITPGMALLGATVGDRVPTGHASSYASVTISRSDKTDMMLFDRTAAPVVVDNLAVKTDESMPDSRSLITSPSDVLFTRTDT